MLFCRKANFVASLHTFWRTFYRPKYFSGKPKMTNIRYLVVLVKVVFVIDIVVMIVDALLDYPSAKSGGDEEQRRKG